MYRYSPEQMKLAKEEHATEMKKRQEKYGGAGKDEVDMGLEDISTNVNPKFKEKKKKGGKKKKAKAASQKSSINGKEL